MPLFRASCRRVLVLGALALVSSRAAAQDSTGAKLVLPPVATHAFLEVYYRSGDPLTKDGYRLRKADLKFSGDISPRLRWRIGFDAGKALALNTTSGSGTSAGDVTGVSVDQKSRIVQDAALTYTFSKALNLDIGQQILPETLEGTVSTWYVETIERSNMIVERSRAVGLGDVRDLGVSANGSSNGLEYHLGLFNEMGDSQGDVDKNDQKSVLARAAYHLPFLPGFQLGGSAGFQGGPPTVEKQRLGTEAQYKISSITLRAESMAARDGLLRRFGWYGLGEYRVTEDFRLVGRYDSWDRDRTGEDSPANAFQRAIVGGASYFIEGGNAKIAVNIVRQTFPNITSIRDATFGLFAFQANF